MASRRKTKKGAVTKTEEPKNAPLIVQELNIMSADRSQKDIGDFKMALQSAESIHYPQRVRLYDLYDDVLIDGHLTGIIEKRADSILNKKLIYKDSGGKKVDLMDKTIKSKVFRAVIKKIMETKAWGLSGLEFIPGPKMKFKELPRKHIKPHKKTISIDQYGEEGTSYDGVSNVWILGDEKDLGYLLKCSFYAIWKRGNMADWAQYIEIFGQPVRIIYYDVYDQKTRTELRKVLDESGSSLTMMIPKQAQFDMKDGKQSNGTGELQEKFYGVCNEEMSIVVLGNTETTKSSSSSGYAQSKEHGKQQVAKTESDMFDVIDDLNSDEFTTILKSYGLPVVDGGYFEYEIETNLEELKTKVEIDIKVSSKVPIADDYWYETYGIPKPDNYDELKAQMEADKAMRNGLDDENTPPKPGKPPIAKKPPVKKPVKNLNALVRLRTLLADFFDPAP